MKTIRISDKYNIDAQIIQVGSDICVITSGGDVPHIGAVSAGVYDGGVGAAGHAPASTKSCHSKSRQTVQLCEGQTATLVLPTHKEGVISEMLAEKLSEKLKKNITVLCGIHMDNISKEEIKEIVDIMNESIEKIANEISIDTADKSVL